MICSSKGDNGAGWREAVKISYTEHLGIFLGVPSMGERMVARGDKVEALVAGARVSWDKSS